MKFQSKKKQVSKLNKFYLLIFCLVIIGLISIASPSLAKYVTFTDIQEQARIALFQTNISSLDITNESENIIELDSEYPSKEIQFTIDNTGETAVRVLIVELPNDSSLTQPIYEFLSETSFYLMPKESRQITMIIHSNTEPSHFEDIQEELQIEIVAEQTD